MQRRNDKRLLATGKALLITHPEIAIVCGRSEAIFLQQLHYWLTTNKDMGCTFEDKRWVYNTYEEWKEQLKIFSLSTIRRVVKKLEQLGIIITRTLGKKRSDRTKWYTINYQVLSQLIPSSHQNSHLLKMNSPCVQNEHIINKKAEITSENKTISSEEIFFEPKKVISQQVNVVKTEIQSKDKNNLANELLEIWNQTVGQGGSLAQLTKKRAQFLVAAFKNSFDSSLQLWKKFCENITTSDFLMGKVKATFRASLDWVLKFDTIQRILEGDFGIGKASPGEPLAILSEQEMIQQIETLATSPLEQTVKKALLQTFGVARFKSYFAQTKIKLEGGRVIILVKNLFHKDQINSTDILNKLTALYPTVSLEIETSKQSSEIFKSKAEITREPTEQVPTRQSINNELKIEEENFNTQTFKQILLAHFGLTTYKSWFENLDVVVQLKKIVLNTSNGFKRDYIKTHYESDLNKLFSDYQLEV